MQSYTTPGEELKSCLTEEMGAESEYRQLAEELPHPILSHSRTAVDWKPVDQAHLFLHVLLLSACLSFFHCHAHFLQKVFAPVNWVYSKLNQ